MKLRELFETDNVVNFKKKGSAISDTLGYAGALQHQRKARGWKPNSMTDVAMDIALRNINSGGIDNWSDEDRDQYHNIMYGHIGIRRHLIQQTIQNTLKQNELAIRYSDPRQAYITDNSDLIKYTIYDKQGKTINQFDYLDDLYLWVIENFIDVSKIADETIKKNIEAYVNELRQLDKEQDIQNRYKQGDPKFDSTQGLDELSAEVEKYLNQFAYSQHQNWRIRFLG